MTDTTSDLFDEVVRVAVELDCLSAPGFAETGPAVIRAMIEQTHDRLPSSASASDSGIRAARMERCYDRTCPQGVHWLGDSWDHDHAVPNDPTGDAATRPSKSDADLKLLEQLQAAFVTAIDEIACKSMSRRKITDWDDAVTVAALLDEMEAVEVLERTDQKPRRWVIKAGDALHDLELLARRHMTREPDDWEKSWTSGLAPEDCCRVCTKLGLWVPWREGGAAGLCQGCYRLRKRCAHETDLDMDAIPDPPPELIEELRRIGAPGGVTDRAARQRWFRTVEARLQEAEGECA